jgi:hypothetical protein
MVHATKEQWEGVKLAQQIFGLSDSLCAAMLRVTEPTVASNRRKGKWERGEHMDPDDPRLERNKVLARADGTFALSVVKIRHVRKVITKPLHIPPIEGTSEELTERMRERFRMIQTQFLMRMKNGTLTWRERMDFEVISEEMRQFERILQSMIRSGVQWRETANETPDIRPPSEAELKALMDKIEKRIDELATRRAERLAAQKPQHTGGGVGHP